MKNASNENSVLSLRMKRGYTLLEMAIVMAVVGILAISFVAVYKIYLKNKASQVTAANAARIVSALNGFLIQQGYYPCPARVDATRTDPDYGQPTNCTPPNEAAPEVAGCSQVPGICFRASDRAVSIVPGSDPPEDPLNWPTAQGAVPFRVLGLPEHLAEDGHKIRFYYAVSTNLTKATYYRKDAGVINILDENDEIVSYALDPGQGGVAAAEKASPHFVIFSTGPDRAGGYTRYGSQYAPCPDNLLLTDPDLNPRDAMNCNMHRDSRYTLHSEWRLARQSLASGTDHYDDYIKFYSSVETPLWKIAGTGGAVDHITDLVGAPTTGKIGIGRDPAQVLDVAGTISTERKDTMDPNSGGTFKAEELCGTDIAGEVIDCFGAGSIGGDDPRFQCDNPAHPDYDPAKPYVHDIGMAKVYCTDTIEVKCPPGSIMTGLGADGSLICTAVSSCPPDDIDTCLDPVSGIMGQYTLPNGVSGQTFLTPVFGETRQYEYQCNGGNWMLIDTIGLCSCTPVDEYINVSCDSALGGGVWTGTGTQHHTITCPDGTETWDPVDTSACVCSPGSATQYVNCSPLTGSYPQDKQWVCDTASSGHWVDPPGWVNRPPPEDPGTLCTCPGTSQFQWFNCNSSTAAGLGYGAGWDGSIELRKDQVCPAGTWGPWYEQTPPVGNCVCDPNYVIWEDVGCGPGEIGSHMRYQQMICPPDPGGPGMSDWIYLPPNCGPPTYQWVAKTQALPEIYPSPLPTIVGQTCTPTPPNDQACSSPTTGGHMHYPSCRCE